MEEEGRALCSNIEEGSWIGNDAIRRSGGRWAIRSSCIIDYFRASQEEEL